MTIVPSYLSMSLGGFTLYAAQTRGKDYRCPNAMVKPEYVGIGANVFGKVSKERFVGKAYRAWSFAGNDGNLLAYLLAMYEVWIRQGNALGRQCSL